MPSMAELTATLTLDSAGFDAGMTSANQQLGQLGTTSASAGAAFNASSVAMAGAATAIGAGIASSISGAAEFQSTMNTVGAVTGATAEQMSQLSAAALDIGAKTSFSAQQGAQAIAELGRAGVPIPDILNGAAQATAT